jgi:DUF4097 and DUF4098 domain-containing protein YvlB
MRVVTLLLALTTPISIRLTVGEITVIAWNRHDVSVEASRAVAVVEAEDSVRVTAQPDHGTAAARPISVTVRVPAGQRVDARVDHGSIEARSLRGDVRLETVIGDIRVEDAVPASGGTIRLRAFNGDIRLALGAPAADARILALSLGGAIHSDVPLTRRTTAGPRFAETTTGRGDALISIDTVRGDIHITGGLTP